MISHDLLTIREFESNDTKSVIKILVHSFENKFQHLLNFDTERLIELLLESRYFDDEFQEGYWVAKYNNEIKGVIKLSWHNKKEKKITGKVSFKELVKKYGLMKVIGLNLALLILSSKPKKRDCYIEHIAVAKSARGLGIGHELLKKAKEYAFENPDFERLTLFVTQENIQAIKLYKKLGFDVVYKKTSFLTKLFFNQKVWFYMAIYKNEELKGKLIYNQFWWLGFIGFLGFLSFEDIVNAFTGSQSYWYLLTLLWFLWFIYFIPNRY